MWTSPHPPISSELATFPATIEAMAGRQPDAPAVVSADRDRVVDYGTLHARVSSIAGELAARGFERGDVLAIWAPNTPGWCAMALAAMRAGGVVTPINPMYTEREVARQLRDSGATMIATLPGLVETALALAPGHGIHEVLSFGPAEGAASILDLLDHAPLEDRSRLQDLALLPYSSGTTGLPKGVMLTHANIAASLQQMGAHLRYGRDDRVLALAPFFHIMGFVLTFALPVSCGATVVTMPRFDFAELLETLERERVTVAIVPPPVATALATHPAVDPDSLETLRILGVGGAPLSPEGQRALSRRFPGLTIGQGYGMTETTVGLTCPEIDRGGTLPGSVGRLIGSTELRIVDPQTGRDCGVGEDGELWARGPQMMRGYLGRPEETAAMIDADGWLRTGDVGHIDADGNIFIVDRLKELIKVKGFQVAPAELEQLLVEHPLVRDAGVIGVPDERTGEAPVAFVVAADDADPDEVRDWLAERVVAYKCPREVRLVDALPRTPTGKLLRRELAAAVAVA